MTERLPVRQGDVLLLPVEDATPGTPVAREGGRLILAHGEATGHHHAIADADVELFTIADGTDTAAGLDLLLRVRSRAGATLTHQEHGAVPVAKGDWIVRKPREYVRQAAPRPVAD